MNNSPIILNCTAEAIHDAALALKHGHLVAFPTETVYGLGADARNPEAVKRIYEVKGRPTDHPLIVHISSINLIEKWAIEIPDYAFDLARKFWPGPMTLILRRSKLAGNFITGGQDSVGLRVPNNPIALELLSKFELLGGLGVAAPSANRFGRLSPTSARDVQEEIGNNLLNIDLILDGGRSDIGIESTIIDARLGTPKILRPGAVTELMISKVIGRKSDYKSTAIELRVSGNLENHYAPIAKVLINQTPKPGQAYIALESIDTPTGVHRVASPRTIEEFAKGLYGAMREADRLNYREVVIEIPIERGLAYAILDRVTKSANDPDKSGT